MNLTPGPPSRVLHAPPPDPLSLSAQVTVPPAVSGARAGEPPAQQGGEEQWRVPLDSRLVPALLLAWCVAWATVRASPLIALITAALSLLLAALLSVMAQRGTVGAGRATEPRRRARTIRQRALLAQWAVAAAVAGVVATSVVAHLAISRPSALRQLIDSAAVVDVEGSVAGDPTPVRSPWQARDSPATGVSVPIRVHRIEGRGRQITATATMVALADSSWSTVRIGTTISATGRLLPAPAGERAVARMRPLGPPRVLRPPSWWWNASEALRQGLRESLAGREGAGAGLVPSLVLGDTSMLTAQTKEELRAAGLSHLTAVSGTNVTIVVGCLLLLVSRLGLRPWARWVVAAMGLAGFVVVARPEPSVLRACVMGAIGLRALVVGRQRDVLAIVNVAAIMLLIWDPWLAGSFGFALSVAATASIVLLAPQWSQTLGRRLPGWVALPLAVTCAAQVGCAPILVLLQPSISLVAVPANLVAAPAVVPATVVGMVAALIALLDPGWAALVVVPAWVSTSWIARVALLGASIPAGNLAWIPGRSGAALLALIEVVAVLGFYQRQRRKPADTVLSASSQSHSRWTIACVVPAGAIRSRPALLWAWWCGRLEAAARAGKDRMRWRWARAGWARAGWARAGWARAGWARAGWLRSATGLGVAAAVVLLIAVLPWPFSPRAPNENWAIAMCDVGQGDATVLRSGTDRAVLIDTGPDPGALDLCLRRLGILHLDAVLLSHFHADHVGGLAGALRDRDAGVVVLPPLPIPASGAAIVRDALGGVSSPAGGRPPSEQAQDGAVLRYASHGWTLTLLLRIPLARSAIEALEHDQGQSSAVNEASVVVRGEITSPRGDRLSIAALGDLQELGQQALLAQLLADPQDDRVDVVKVAHHGSARQVRALYARLRASVAVIGVGEGNDYGHPTSSALAMLSSTGAMIRRTDRDGLTVVRSQTRHSQGVGRGVEPELIIGTDSRG